MAKKIEGYVDGTGEGPEFTPYKEGNQYFPFWEAQGITLKPKFDYWRKAVVVVTNERVFTESEVSDLEAEVAKLRALVQELLNSLCLPIVSVEAKVEHLKQAQSAIASAKELGFVPTNTTQDNGN